MKYPVLFAAGIFIALSSLAQKKPLDHSVYDGWQHIGERLVSHDGSWVVFTIDPQEGDNELVISRSDGSYRKTVARGYNALITEDSRYLVFKLKAPYRQIREARIKKKRPDDMPKDSLAIVELGKEEVWKKPAVRNYKIPAKSAGWVAFQLEKMPESAVKKPAAPNGNQTLKVADSLRRVIDSLTALLEQQPKKKKRDGDDEWTDPGTGGEYYGTLLDAEGDEPGGAPADTGNDLLLRNLLTGEEKLFEKVLDYQFSRNGDKLLMKQARNPADSSSLLQVLLYDLKEAKAITLSRGGNDFRNFALTDDGRTVAYLAERDARPKDLQKYYRIWYYRAGMDSAALLLDKNSPGMKLGMTISEHGNLSFSKSGARLFYGIAPIQPPRDTSLVELDYPKVDIWHYKDDYLQTVQTQPNRLRAAQQENYLSVYHFDTRSHVQLASREMPQVMPSNEGDGETFVGVTDFGKRVESQWTGATRKDIYAVQVSSGKRILVKENLHGQAYPSSTGRSIVWYDRRARHYFAWDGSRVRNVSEKIKQPLWNEENDVPDEPNNYGLMGWHQGDSAVYVYDRFDIWKLPLQEGGQPVNISKSGRSARERFRYISTDPEHRFFTNGQTVFFRKFNTENKSDAIVQTSLGETLSFRVAESCACAIGPVTKARRSERLIYTKESFGMNPDLYANTLSTSSPAVALQLSSINPQQAEYLWGQAELFKWKAYNGKDATGVLYKPDNFDPKKKYPLLIYFYEKLSDNLYDYKEPAPIRSAINIPFFVSRGYLVFTPDIEYKTGYPGQGAYDYIVSGARALVKRGWADSTRIGIQGHSWGGYQAAQLATMTKLFKAVWAGAPVANMTSAYGGIRWESGVSRQFQYEKTQSRIGATLWEKLPLYILNSPLFHLDKVTAPMVIMHNDADGAVPWYQGIELFTALRRLGKQVWMFNYNGQGHGLNQRQDMRDYQIRMQQFFDWQLKGEKPAKWITEGVPAVKKGKEWGLESAD